MSLPQQPGSWKPCICCCCRAGAICASAVPSGPDSVGPSTFSRSAIGHAGIAEVLAQLSIPVVKSRSSSLEKLSPGSVLVIAEPRPSGQTEDAIRTLMKASTILLVLPKWTGEPSDQKARWLREVGERSPADA